MEEEDDVSLAEEGMGDYERLIRAEEAEIETGRPQGIPRDGEPQDRPSVSREGE